jgi:hypothetical protein
MDIYGYDSLKNEMGKEERLVRLTDYSTDAEVKESKNVQSPRDNYCLDYNKLTGYF